MNAGIFALVLGSVGLSALAQMLLKLGVGAARAGHAGAPDSDVPTLLVAYLTNPQVLGGLTLYGIGAVAWLFVLARLPLSVAYPFVGLGFVFTMLIGALALNEGLSATRIAGTLLIALGCVLVARSA
jgi:multidrug transporter EmrE-like cation transporter